MAVRRPLVVVGGVLQELPQADTLPGVGGGGISLTIDDTAPSSPSTGSFWLRPSDGVLSIYVPTTAGGFAWAAPMGAQGPAGAAGTNAVLGGSNTQLIYNNSGTASGDSTLTFNNTTKVVSASRLTLSAGTTAGAPLTIIPGVAPTTPTDGDIWTTTAGVYARVNGTTLMLSGGPPGGGTKDVQYNNGGVLAGASNVEIDNGDITIAVNTAPVTPPADQVKLFGRKLGSRVFPAAVGPSGMDYALQPSIWRQKVAMWNPTGNAATAPTTWGIIAGTALGTLTARAVATTNLLTRTRRAAYVSASGTAGSVGGIHWNVTAGLQWTTGNGTGLGGFFASFRFAITDAATVSGARSFVGMRAGTTAPSNVEPNGVTNQIGVAQLSTDATQLYLVYGGSTAQTAIALGTNFPPMTGSGATLGVLYDLSLFAPPSSNGVIGWRLERIGTTFATEGVITPASVGVQTPSSTTFLAPCVYRTNNASTLAVATDIVTIYIETDF